jgi:hypothetical protein
MYSGGWCRVHCSRLRRIFTISFYQEGAPTWRLLALTLIRFRRELESRTEVKCFPCAGQNKSASVVLWESDARSGQRWNCYAAGAALIIRPNQRVTTLLRLIQKLKTERNFGCVKFKYFVKSKTVGMNYKWCGVICIMLKFFMRYVIFHRSSSVAEIKSLLKHILLLLILHILIFVKSYNISSQFK